MTSLRGNKKVSIHFNSEHLNYQCYFIEKNDKVDSHCVFKVNEGFSLKKTPAIYTWHVGGKSTAL